MTPNPEQVDIHHRVALSIDREEMKAEVTIEQQHRQGRSQNREGRDNEKVRGERRPAENRHAHKAHPGRPRLKDRCDEVYSGHQRADAGDLQRPEIIVDADAGRELQFA